MAKIWISRFDPELAEAFKRLFVGIGVKTIGYLTITAGIFLAIKNRSLALNIVFVGIILVALGWVLIVRALKQSKH